MYKYSLIIPIYKSESSIERLINVLNSVCLENSTSFEVVFVNDDSPDGSLALLLESMKQMKFPTRIVSLSKNFGSFAAIRQGMIKSRGEYIGVLSADLQEPPELLWRLFEQLVNGDADIAFGVRNSRNDPIVSKLLSTMFWAIYRRFVIKEIPKGGVDIFACTSRVKDVVLSLKESNSSLIGLLFWVGFKRTYVSYDRLGRLEGKSAWSLSKKINYMLDSIFSFTDLPIKLMIFLGSIGLGGGVVLGIIVFIAKSTGIIVLPGYATIVLLVMIFGSLQLLTTGIAGTYAWRSYENTKIRPESIVAHEVNN